MLRLVLYLWNLLLRLACCLVECLRSTAVVFLEAVLSAVQGKPLHSTAPLFLAPPDDFNSSLTKIAFISTNNPPNLDTMTQEFHTRLRLSTEEAFPDGEPPRFNASSPLALSPNSPRPPRYVPFIRATRIVLEPWLSSRPDLFIEDQPQVILKNVWCLWDTGSDSSCIVTNALTDAVRRHRDRGWADMKISFDGVNHIFNSTIYFQPTLPHGTTFVILGQHGEGTQSLDDV